MNVPIVVIDEPGALGIVGGQMLSDSLFTAQGKVGSRLKPIEEEVRRMLKEAQRVDAEEDLLFGPDGRGGALPQELGRRGERLSRLGEAKARLGSLSWRRRFAVDREWWGVRAWIPAFRWGLVPGYP